MAAPTPHRPIAPTRDSLTTVADDGSRIFLHPADVSGRFTLGRRAAALVLIALYVLLPWIPVRGNPAVFLDVVNLRFHFFGLTFAAQDLWLAFFLISGLGFSLFYVTALFGRLWCGWACPQTVFLEHVYRRIERLLEGDALRRRQLDKAPWTGVKALRRGTKQLLFVLVSLIIAHVLLAYFVSLPHEWEMITGSPFEHWGIFVFIVVATGILYFNFAWFREQLCIVICPYGRLQSALIDDDSLSIGYDTRRGEPRGKLHHDAARTEPVNTGDCIDCFRCVQVCPTGIDIRQGLQLECIGCANCIDACDDVMTRLHKPRGLIRYDSLNGLAGLKTRFLRPRIVLYTVLLCLGLGVATFSVSRYRPANITAVRMQGAPYFVDAGSIRNQYLVRIINKQNLPVAFSLKLKLDEHAPAGVHSSGWEQPVVVAMGAEEVQPLIVTVPRDTYTGRFEFRIVAASSVGDFSIERVLEFTGPDPRLLQDNAAPAH